MALIKCPDCGKEISSEAPSCVYCGRPMHAPAPLTQPASPHARGGCVGRSTKGCLIILLILIGLGVLGQIVERRSGSSSGTSNSVPSPPPPSPKEQALAKTKLSFEWHKGGFDNVMIADFTITNRSTFAIKDIEIKCVHSAASGTVIDPNTQTIYDIVPAGKTRHFTNVNMGFIHTQAARSSCEISDVVVM